MDPSSAVPTSARPSLLRRVDTLLRQTSAHGTAELPPARELVQIAVICGAVYGVAMGIYALSMRGWYGAAQVVATAIKVPLLCFLTIAVTFPSFYVLTAVRGSTASATELWRIQVVGASLMTAMLASLGPILLFFTLSTESHGFMVVLNTVFFAVAGALGLRAIWIRCRAALQRETTGGSNSLLRAWIVIAVLVGMQSAWILRPLVGRPDDSFTVFEPRGSNAFAGFLSVFSTSDG